MTLTAPVTLNLMTPATMRQGLALVGLDWTYTAWDATVKPATVNHLYLWGVGEENDTLAGVYAGIDESWDGHRIKFEHSAATTAYVHGHARAVVRTGAKVVSGPVLRHTPHLQWGEQFWGADDLAALATKWSGLLETERTLRVAEQFAIRLSIHVGDTGVPVNSEHKGAWGIKSRKGIIVDDLAELTARHMMR